MPSKIEQDSAGWLNPVFVATTTNLRIYVGTAASAVRSSEARLRARLPKADLSPTRRPRRPVRGTVSEAPCRRCRVGGAVEERRFSAASRCFKTSRALAPRLRPLQSVRFRPIFVIAQKMFFVPEIQCRPEKQPYRTQIPHLLESPVRRENPAAHDGKSPARNLLA
jgi:hypothetical protein